VCPCSVSSLAWFMSNQEASFVTLGQRTLAVPLKSVPSPSTALIPTDRAAHDLLLWGRPGRGDLPGMACCACSGVRAALSVAPCVLCGSPTHSLPSVSACRVRMHHGAPAIALPEAAFAITRGGVSRGVRDHQDISEGHLRGLQHHAAPTGTSRTTSTSRHHPAAPACRLSEEHAPSAGPFCLAASLRHRWILGWPLPPAPPQGTAPLCWPHILPAPPFPGALGLVLLCLCCSVLSLLAPSLDPDARRCPGMGAGVARGDDVG